MTAEKDGSTAPRLPPPMKGSTKCASRRPSITSCSVRTRSICRLAPSDSEFYDSTMGASLLERVAEETGGRFYTPDTVGTLPDDVQYGGRRPHGVEERDLWDMPALLLLLVGLGRRMGLSTL